MPLPDAVVFDLDGTLIDSIPDVRNALNVMMEHHGRPKLTLPAVRTMVGHGAGVMLEMAFAHDAPAIPVPEDALAVYLAAYHDNPTGDTIVYDGAREALEALRQRGVALGICTNKPGSITRVVVERLGLAPYFSAIVTGDDVAHRKPDGRHVTDTLVAMGRPGARAVMVGDATPDVAAAQSAGIPSVVVSFGYEGEEARRLGATVVIDHFSDLIPTLESLS